MSTESIRSVTYVSHVTAPLAHDAFVRLGLEAGRLNALDGITGLLVFNGRSFCQTIEGSPAAVEDLLIRLRRDTRHHGIVIIADENVDRRRFRSWDMQLIAVPEDREAALAVARARLDSPADLAARTKLYETVAGAFG